MKDLKLPKRSKEEENEIFKNLKPGDKLVKIERSHWYINDYRIGYYTVKNKTPKGSIRFTNGDLLKYLPSDFYLPFEVEDWLSKKSIENEIMDYLFKIDKDKEDFKDNLEYQDAVELNKLLEKIFNKEVEDN